MPLHPMKYTYSDSVDNSAWSDWMALTTVNTSATNGSLSVSPPTTRGNYRRFRIRTRGTAGEAFTLTGGYRAIVSEKTYCLYRHHPLLLPLSFMKSTLLLSHGAVRYQEPVP